MGGSERDVGTADAANGVGLDTIAELQQRIDVLSAFAGGVLCELDRDGRFLGIWTGEEHLLARPANEMIGRTISDTIGPASGARIHAMVRDVVDAGAPSDFEHTLDVRAGRRTFSCAMRPLDPRGGGQRRVTLMLRDITVAKQLEGKLVRTERLAALGLLAASVGHEIRQPLAFLTTSLDGLEAQLGRAGKAAMARTLEDIRGGARRIIEIAASLDLLAGARREATDVDVRRPLGAALELCAGELSSVELEKTIEEVPAVLADEGELCQVFANLLLNAVQSLAAEAAGSPRSIRVMMCVAPDLANVLVTVTDTGAGIAEKHIAHVFDPFFTTKEEHGGTGLGLFVARGSVQAHGGTLEVASSIGRGTMFTVSLPLATNVRAAREAGAKRASPADEAPADEALRTASGSHRADAPSTGVRPVLSTSDSPGTGRRRRLRVLVIDDEPRFLESLRLALEDAHLVETRAKADVALELLRADPQRFDVVLCDLAMPGMDGVAFYDRMVEMGVGERFILMTGGAFTARASAFIRSGASPSISKPFLLERLLALLDEVTQARRAS
jgi:signal transduction histidine kinase/CheY-like chemotaxis protein